MNSARQFPYRSFVVFFLFILLIMAGLNAALYYGLKLLTAALAGGTSETVVSVPVLNLEIAVIPVEQLTQFFQLLLSSFTVWVVPTVVGFFLLLIFMVWLMLRVALSGSAVAVGDNTALVDKKQKKGPAEQRMEQERKRRVFLHMLSVLQREGRLLDFFGEDLSLYEDEQIGAAVRSIHEECKTAVDKYIAPVPVMDQEEGESVDIEPGFDPDAVKLTGNVAGDPPFKGVLRHRGWKAGKKEIPRLADVMDAGIIAPAEVEIE